MSNKYTIATRMLQRNSGDNHNIKLLVKDLEKFLHNYINFDSKDYCVSTADLDGLVINIQVKVKGFVDIKYFN